MSCSISQRAMIITPKQRRKYYLIERLRLGKTSIMTRAKRIMIQDPIHFNSMVESKYAQELVSEYKFKMKVEPQLKLDLK